MVSKEVAENSTKAVTGWIMSVENKQTFSSYSSSGMHHQECVAVPYVNISVHRGRFWARSVTASFSVRL